MEVTIKVTNQQIKDQFCSAFEGGSNYWINSIDQRPDWDGSHDMAWNDAAPLRFPFTIKHLDAAESKDDAPHKTTTVHDMAQVARGLALMAEKSPRHFADLMDENGDATTGDVFLQYVLFGYVIFG